MGESNLRPKLRLHMGDAAKLSMTSRASALDAWLTPGRFALLLAVLVAAMFPDVLTGSHTFFFRDYLLYGYPVAFHHREAFWNGEVPLWNPMSNSGLPFLAEWSMLALYPPSFFYLLFPLSWALGVFCLFHLWLGGIGMYWLAASWTRSRLAGSFAGVAFAFNGFMLSCLIWPHHIASMAWMPWVLLAVRSAWERGGLAVIVAAVIGSMQMLTGPPEVILATWLPLALLWAGHLLKEPLHRRQVAMRFLVVVLVITCLCAAQIFPFLEFLTASQRDRDFGGVTWSLPATGWANLLVPMINLRRSPLGVYMFLDQGIATSYYAGILVLVMAALASAWVKDWRCRLCALCSVACLVLALGDQSPLFPALRSLFPQIGFMRYPVKFIIPLTLAFPLLGAWALAALLSAQAGAQTRMLRTLGVAVCVCVAFVGLLLWWNYAVPLLDEPWSETAINGCSRVALLLATLALLMFVLRQRTGSRQALGGFLLVLLTWADLASQVPNQNPTVDRGVYEPGLPDLEALKPRPAIGQSRLLLTVKAMKEQRMLTDPVFHCLAQRLHLFRDVNFFDHIPKVDGFYSLYPREEQELRYALHVGPDTYRSAIADFLGVSQVNSDTNSFTFIHRPTFMPLITAGQAPVFADAIAGIALMESTNWNPREVVILRQEARLFTHVTNRTSAHVVPGDWSDHRIQFKVEAEAPSLAVISQTFYRAWRAEVNGQPSPILRANHNFQAIEVPAGKCDVVLRYVDRVFQGGLVVSWLALIGCGLHCAMRRGRPIP